jgi:hypothetical protein
MPETQSVDTLQRARYGARFGRAQHDEIVPDRRRFSFPADY